MRAGFVAGTALALASWLAIAAAAQGAPRLPAGFSDDAVAPVFGPSALAFTPDGDLLIATKFGRLMLLREGERDARDLLDLRERVCTRRERGLVGLAVDPEFERNRFVYVYFTRIRDGCGTRAVNRVSRFVLPAEGPIDPASERVLLDNIPSPVGIHQAGDLQFGHDGFLYVSVGDGGCHYATLRCELGNDAAREPHVLLGKILRVDREGNPAPGNPGGVACGLAGRARRGTRCAEIFATGLRNPFRMAFDPTSPDTRFLINDVGSRHWEEVNEGRLGADYGWNLREGPCRAGRRRRCGRPRRGLTQPIHAYSHRSGCSAITGGAFVPSGTWPEGLRGDYVFGDYVCGRMFLLERDDRGRFRARTFGTRFGTSSVVHLLFGPGPRGTSLYYTTFVRGGEVRRISYAGGNRRPTAAVAAAPRFGPVPLEVRFDARRSSDPDGGEGLTYLWDFGDGSSLETAAPVVRHSYGAEGTYFAELRVRDAEGALSDPRRTRIDAGNSPPAITVRGPRRYRFGERVVLRATARDPEDGPLAAGGLAWHILLHHERHTHPFLDPVTGGRLVFDAPRLEDRHAVRTTFLRVTVRATDSRGLSGKATWNLRPRVRRRRGR